MPRNKKCTSDADLCVFVDKFPPSGSLRTRGAAECALQGGGLEDIGSGGL